MSDKKESGENDLKPSYHTKLLGLKSEDLMKIAPLATHQHYKGGLYRKHGGTINSKEVGEPSIVIMEHIHPYQRRKFYISYDEFSEKVNDSTEPRYKNLKFNPHEEK